MPLPQREGLNPPALQGPAAHWQLAPQPWDGQGGFARSRMGLAATFVLRRLLWPAWVLSTPGRVPTGSCHPQRSQVPHYAGPRAGQELPW